MICYHILTQTGKVISISTVQQVTNLELSTDEVKETFVNFDTEIHQSLKADNRGYKGSKPSPQDWADMLEEDTDFPEEFKRVFNNANIPEVDDLHQRCLKINMFIWR